MGVEIERKFLLQPDFEIPAEWHGVLYRQGYLGNGFAPTVRARIAGDKAFLTLKGAMANLSRLEYEYQIPVTDAEELLKNFAGKNVVSKVRYKVEYADWLWEVDVFEDANAGLRVAEVEMPTPDTVVELPPWVGEEVSHDRRYANSALAARPYCLWKDEVE